MRILAAKWWPLYTLFGYINQNRRLFFQIGFEFFLAIECPHGKVTVF